MSDVTTESATTQSISRAEYCAVACAEIFAGAGEIFASPMTPMATIQRASSAATVARGPRGKIAMITGATMPLPKGTSGGASAAAHSSSKM